MAALTLADYLGIVRSYLDESPEIESARYPNDVITRALNNGGRRLVRDTELYFFRNTATMNATTGDISPPADFMGNGSLTLVINSTTRQHLPVVSAKSMYMDTPNWVSQTAQYPTKAVSKIKADGSVAVVLWPAPTATITNGLFWEYASLPEPMEAEEDEFIPLEPFEELQPVLLPAAAMCELLHKEAGVLDLQWQKWDALYARETEKLREYINGLFQIEPRYGQ